MLSKDFHARKLYVDWKSKKCSLKIIFYFILVISLKIIHSCFKWSLMNRRNYLQILRHWIQHILDQWSQYKHEKQTRDFTVLIRFQKLFCFRQSYLWQWCVEGTTLQYLYFYVFVINRVTRREIINVVRCYICQQRVKDHFLEALTVILLALSSLFTNVLFGSLFKTIFKSEPLKIWSSPSKFSQIEFSLSCTVLFLSLSYALLASEFRSVMSEINSSC